MQYWSGAQNHCAVLQCNSAAITVPVFGAVTVTVSDTTGAAQADLPVYAFDGTTYTGFHATTDAQGQATFSLPEGNYRFRVDKNTLPGAGSVQYWSGTQNHCTVVQCNSAAITVPVFGVVMVTVNDSTGAAQADLPVYAFDGTTYTGFHASTDAQGRAILALPQGNYHFRADVHGHPLLEQRGKRVQPAGMHYSGGERAALWAGDGQGAVPQRRNPGGPAGICLLNR